MTRRLTANDIIQLPRLSGNEAAVLATELHNAATHAAKELPKHALPGNLDASRKRLAIAHDGLKTALLPTASGAQNSKAQVEADRVIDNAWSATHDWLGGWTKLPNAKNAAEARALYDLVFPNQLSFTQLAYKVEWQESESRLLAIAANGHDKTFKHLGGEQFLSHLHAAHDAYGVAIGVTVPKAQVEKGPALRPALDGLLTALRDYVNKVTAYSDPDVRGSEELTNALLGPLATWESRHPTAQATTTPTEPAVPSPKA